MNNRTCSVEDSGKIYYDVDSIDVKVDPTTTKVTAFEALFLSDVISEITGSCFTIEENCKSQYPLITKENSSNWITSIDQENRVGLAHVMETSRVPILYNTPRLCDPGMTVSKNWSLKNYIETRLYAFKYKFDQGRTATNRNQNNKTCYTSVYFDFRPFVYKMRLPNPKNNKSVEEIYVSEWITVDPGKDGCLGYTPHMKVSNKPFNPSNSSKYQTLNIFKQMVKKVMMSPLGSNNKSVIANSINLKPNGNATNAAIDSYINEFIRFLNRYDGVQFDIPVATQMQTLRLTDRAISVLYYDLIHDKVFKKTEYKLEKFRSTFKKQFKAMALASNRNVGTEFNFLVGAKMAAKSHKAYKGRNGNILLSEWRGNLKKDDKGNVIPVLPSIFKTLGDLSQFVYAATYNTVVASGDKMGMACGLFMTASVGRKIKLMMEDAVTGFVLYTGFNKIQFVSKSSCIAQKSGACTRSTNTIRNKSEVVKKIQTSISPENVATRNQIVKRRPVKPNLTTNLRVFNSSNTLISKNTSQMFFSKVQKFLPHFTEQELDKVEKILMAIERRTSQVNRNVISRDLRVLRRSIESVKNPPELNSPKSNQPTPMNVNTKANLRAFLNRPNLNRLTPNNKNQFMKKLNQNGSNLQTIKNTAYNLHRVRVFNSKIERNRLTNQQYNNFVKRIKNNESLQSIVNDARRGVKRLRT